MARSAALLIGVLALFELGCGKKVEKPQDSLAQDQGGWKFLYFNDEKVEAEGKKLVREYYYFFNGSLLSVTASGSVIIWHKSLKRELTSSTKASAGQEAIPPLPYSLMRLEMSCEEQKYRALELHTYNAQGSQLSQNFQVQGWATVVPDTLGHRLYLAACESPAKQEYEVTKNWKAVAEFIWK